MKTKHRGGTKKDRDRIAVNIPLHRKKFFAHKYMGYHYPNLIFNFHQAI